MAESADVEVEKYRKYIHGDGEKETIWRHGAPPTYDLVNKLFEEGRTKEWPKGSLEEIVQNAVKSWEMELSHKTRLSDFKTINSQKFTMSVNGRRALSGEETLEKGSYNALLESSLPEKYQQYYNAEQESFESSHEVFRTAFPSEFAWEVLAVYSGPPLIAFKYRHWGFMDGPYKGHAPTGKKVEFTGMAVLKVDEHLKLDNVEVYYDQGELFGGLVEGPLTNVTQDHDEAPSEIESRMKSCPFLSGSTDSVSK